MVRMCIVYCMLALMLNACNKPYSTSQSSAPVPQAMGHVRDYFPCEVGNQWTYEVETPGKPVCKRIVGWPNAGSQGNLSKTVGFIGKPKRQALFKLVLRVKGKAPTQGLMQYKESYEIEVVEDGLGIFEYHKEVFWSMVENSSYMVIQTIAYPPNVPGSPFGWHMDGGYSMDIVLFEGEAGTAMSLKPYSLGKLTFVEAENNCLHFMKAYEAEDTKGRKELGFHRAFVEDMWFERGKGLVALEQRVAGELSMKWKLIHFEK